MNQINLEDIVDKMKEMAIKASLKLKHSEPVHYTKKDIKELVKQGKSDDYICDTLRASETDVMRIRAAVDAHYTMGTYSRYECKIRNRKLTETEKEKVYRDIEKSMGSEELAEKYRLTRIKAMIYRGWYTRRLNEK